jgi:hypothetical protein
MITLRVAEVLAHEVNGTAWEAACLRKGKDPLDATADDILGPMATRMTYDGGKPVLPYDDDRLADALADLEAPEPVTFVQEPKAFVTEVTEIAGLTRQEKRVVAAIVDGSPIPDGKRYTEVLALRLKMTTNAVRLNWSRAKKKLRDNWAAE